MAARSPFHSSLAPQACLRRESGKGVVPVNDHTVLPDRLVFRRIIGQNPVRASFSGSTWLIGDVGQGAIEEIDAVTTTQPGLNFGWRFLEGTQPYSGTAPAGLTPPVAE